MQLASLLLACVLGGTNPPDAPLLDAPTADQEPQAPSPQAARRRRGWNDQRRTVRSYTRNLRYNALRVFSKPNLPRLLIGTGLSAGSSFLDGETVDLFERRPMRTFGSVGATVGGTGAVAALAVGLFSAGRISPGDRFRSSSYDASQAILITTAYTFGLKFATRRERPDGSNRRSFPSGHASVAFSWATVFQQHYGPKVGVPAFAVASLIATSRLAHRSHYLSDIVAGAALGHVVGRTVFRGNSRPAEGVPAKPIVPGPKLELRVVPCFGPAGGSGLALAVSF